MILAHGLRAHPEQARGPGLASPGSRERPLEEAPPGVVEETLHVEPDVRLGKARGGGRGIVGELQVGGVDRLARRELRRPLDDVQQSAHVARPFVRGEALERGGGQAPGRDRRRLAFSTAAMARSGMSLRRSASDGSRMMPTSTR